MGGQVCTDTCCAFTDKALSDLKKVRDTMTITHMIHDNVMITHMKFDTIYMTIIRMMHDTVKIN